MMADLEDFYTRLLRKRPTNPRFILSGHCVSLTSAALGRGTRRV